MKHLIHILLLLLIFKGVALAQSQEPPANEKGKKIPLDIKPNKRDNNPAIRGNRHERMERREQWRERHKEWRDHNKQWRKEWREKNKNWKKERKERIKSRIERKNVPERKREWIRPGRRQQ